MTTDTHERVHSDETVSSPSEIIARLRNDILLGEAWYPALLRAVAAWRLPAERVGDRQYRYLIGGEAFDWLLLAERLTDAIDDLIPADERDALLFFNRPPAETDPEEFRALIGPVKYRAHLNFLYGVIVEEALQLSVEQDVHKELRCRVWGSDRRVDETVFERIYGHTREDLLQTFRSERGAPYTPILPLTELREFTYWLFKQRIATADPARIASDTRRGLAQISQLDSFRRIPQPEPIPAAPTIDA
jgi:hypothetical protein